MGAGGYSANASSYNTTPKKMATTINRRSAFGPVIRKVFLFDIALRLQPFDHDLSTSEATVRLSSAGLRFPAPL